MARFNQFASPFLPRRNIAGGKAFSLRPELELVHAVLTTFLKDEFYESGTDRTQRIFDLVYKISKKDPVFVAKLAVFARKEFHLRSVTTVLLAALSKAHKGDDLVKRAIVAATERVDDLTELAALVGTPMPKQVKRGIRNALLKFSGHQLAKYKGKGKKVSLVDLFNLVHPKAQHATDEQQKAWSALINGTLVSNDTWESEVSGATDEAGRKEAFEMLIKKGKMGYMAMLRNLNNFIKYKVDDFTMDMVVMKLTNAGEVAISKQLPFRFYTAYENVKGNRRLSDAISDALDLSMVNVPIFEGKMLVAVDASGSMVGSTIRNAAILAAALARSNNADLILYDEQVKELSVSSRTPVMDISNKIIESAMGGGTQTSLVFKHALNGQEYKRIVILSDNQSWQESYSDSSVQAAYEAYKKQTGFDPYVYAIDIQGYGTMDMQKSPRVFHIAGWTEKILDVMRYSEEGDLILTRINAIEL